MPSARTSTGATMLPTTGRMGSTSHRAAFRASAASRVAVAGFAALVMATTLLATGPSPVAAAVPATTTAQPAIVLGINHTCALLTTGTVKCWGRNGFGQLGDNSVTTRYAPTTVTGLTGVTALAAGE